MKRQRRWSKNENDSAPFHGAGLRRVYGIAGMPISNICIVTQVIFGLASWQLQRDLQLDLPTIARYLLRLAYRIKASRVDCLPSTSVVHASYAGGPYLIQVSIIIAGGKMRKFEALNQLLASLSPDRLSNKAKFQSATCCSPTYGAHCQICYILFCLHHNDHYLSSCNLAR